MKITVEKFQGESEESRLAERIDDAEARADFWSGQGDFVCHHHNETRVQLYMTKEETFPIPLKYIDVTGSTHTDLDVMQAKHINDDWNVDSNKHSSDSWRGFTKPNSIEGKNAKGFKWSGARLTKIQTTTGPDHVWPEVWTRIGKAPQNREKQAWAREKPKLDKARRLRGIYCVDPDDKEYSETLKNARRKLEGPMAPAMLCKS